MCLLLSGKLADDDDADSIMDAFDLDAEGNPLKKDGESDEDSEAEDELKKKAERDPNWTEPIKDTEEDEGTHWHITLPFVKFVLSCAYSHSQEQPSALPD